MNVYSISFQTVLSAFRHQWKRILVSVLIFALLGGAAGFLFRDRGMAEAGGGAQPLKPVDFSSVAHTQNYYTNCLGLLKDTMTNLNNYIASVSANALPVAAQGTEAQETLDTLSREAAVLQSRRIALLQSVLEERGAVYAPEEYLNDMVDIYTRELASLQIDLIAAETAAETIRQMDAPDYDADFTGTYTNLLSQAANYGSLLKSQATTEKYLERLTNHMPEIRAECRRIERELDAIRDELNTLLDRFAPLADELAREAGLTFVSAGVSGDVRITVTHSHRASSAEESFTAIMVFCVLVGLCFGVFLAVCREAKAEKARLSPSAEEADGSP